MSNRYWVDLEKPITHKGKRWIYGYSSDTPSQPEYVCLSCDVSIDEKGYCLLCGAPSPLAIE